MISCEYKPNLNAKSLNDFKQAEDSFQRGITRKRDKSEFSALEQVLDQKTKLLISSLKRNGLIDRMTGVISSGKEAVVYSAEGGGRTLAMKIFKRGAMDFRRREKYFDGDRRFDNPQLRSNARKMVKLWAEKEFRNLKILEKSEIPSPAVIKISNHVLLMEFIGDESAAPRLKDAIVNNTAPLNLFKQSIWILRELYSKCRLVHADYSEYNLLVYKGVVFLIDVGSAVSTSNPNAKEFLRTDCINIRNFFLRNNISPLSLSQIFHFVTQKSIKGDEEMELNRLIELNDSITPLKDDFSDLEVKLASIETNSLYEIDEEKMFDYEEMKKVDHLIEHSESAEENDIETIGEEEMGGKKQKRSGKNRSKEELKEERKRNKKVVKTERKIKLLEKVPKKVKRRRDKMLKKRHQKN